MTGRRIAVLGLGRSGASIAESAARRGASVTIFDEKPIESLTPSVVEKLLDLDISISAGFGHERLSSHFDVVATSPGLSKFHPLLRTSVEAGMDVVSEIEFAFGIARAPIVAVTGTNGKSTTTLMAFLCLKRAGIQSVLCGNIYGSGFEEQTLTEAAEATPAEGVLVAEISSFQLEWIRSFRPRSATITNIAQDHLNRYEDLADYASTKRRIFENMGDGDTAVWKVGDRTTEPPRSEGLRVASYGRVGADLWIEEGLIRSSHSSIGIDELPFDETHNLQNAMAAVLLSEGAADGRADTSALMRGLKDFRGLEHRMERLGSRDGVLIINNSMCTNPAAVVASSLSVSKRQHLLVGGVDKNMDFGPLREHLGQSPHVVYLFGGSAEEIGRQLGGRWPVFHSMGEAFAAAVAAALPGEAVMLAPGAASTDQFKDFRDRGEQFRAMAKEWRER